MLFNTTETFEPIQPHELNDYPNIRNMLDTHTMLRKSYVSFDDSIGDLKTDRPHQLQLILLGYAYTTKVKTNYAQHRSFSLQIRHKNWSLTNDGTPIWAHEPYLPPTPQQLIPGNPARFSLNIWRIRRCTPEERNALPQPQETKGMAIALTRRANQYVRVYQHNTQLNIMLYEWLTPQMLYLILSMLGSAFPTLALDPELLDALINKSETQYCNRLEQMIRAEQDAILELKRQEQRKNIITLLQDGQLPALRKNVERARAEYNNQLDVLNQRQRTLKEQEQALFAKLYSGQQSQERITEFVNYMFNRKAVAEVETSSDRIYLNIVTPLLYWDTQAAITLCSSQRENQLNKTTRIKQAATNIFINQIHRIVFKTGIVWDLDSCEVGWSRDFTRDGPPNPHLSEYTCFGDHKPLIQKALREGNYEVALEQTIASCASLNLFDGPVMRTFFEKMNNNNTSWYYNKPLIEIDTATNTNMRWLDYLHSEHCIPKAEGIYETADAT